MKYIKKFDSVSDMDTALASSTISVVGMAMNGNTPVVKVREVTPTPPGPDYSEPFYIEDISGSSNTVSIKKSDNSAPTITIEKSSDGETWETMGSTSTTGITATVPANGKLYLRCSATSWGNSYYNAITTTLNCNVGGNVMSLLYGSSFTGDETTFPSGSTDNFKGLFYSNSKLISASELLLPATTIANYCYYQMFYGCTSLTTAPELPATTIANYCYYQMFYGCTSLTTVPAILPATTLADNCYVGMFYGCTSLTTAPELPATTLAQQCYSGMFSGGCTSLTTAPALPATTLANYCYQYMFYGCTSLTTAPALPATTLATQCYQQMFQNCTNLNYIKCLATNISATNCTKNWVKGVAVTGTFVKNPNMSTSTWGTENNGIPSGWTVEDATE